MARRIKLMFSLALFLGITQRHQLHIVGQKHNMHRLGGVLVYISDLYRVDGQCCGFLLHNATALCAKYHSICKAKLPTMLSNHALEKNIIDHPSCTCNRALKVRLSQDGFLKSSIFQKMTPKIGRISALCTIKTLRAEILQNFRVNFWKLMIS